MSLGLVMGGGGIVGIAWETGVLAGLREACGFDPTSATVIMGSSAGSVIGAQAALGRDVDELVDFQRRPPGARPPRGQDRQVKRELHARFDHEEGMWPCPLAGLHRGAAKNPAPAGRARPLSRGGLTTRRRGR